MALTTITTGMTTAQFVTAVNDNMTFLAMHGRHVELFADMPDWEVASALKINGLGDYSASEFGGTEFINKLNAAFINLQSNPAISVVGATDVKTVGAAGNGVAEDAAAINAALVTGNVLIQDGVFLIEESIKIPSNRTVYIYNAQIKAKNTTYDNIFRNLNINTGNVNCKIIGLGCAELYVNGGNNDDDYATYGTNVPWDLPVRFTQSYRYIHGFMCQVDGFEIANLLMYDPVHWYYCLQSCKNGSFHDIYSLRIRHSANQAMLTTCFDSHEIDIYNIAGNNDDDTFAWAAYQEAASLVYIDYANYNVGNVHDINVWNVDVHASSGYAGFGSLCTVLCGNGQKVYNIDYKNIRAREAGTLFYSSFENYVLTPCAKTDFYNITMDKCQIDKINTKVAALYFGANMMNSAFTNISYPLENLRRYYTAGDQSDNVKINGEQI